MVKKDRSQVDVFVNGKQAINELGKLEMEARELRSDLKSMKKGSDEYVAASKKLDDVTQKIRNQRKEMGITGMTMQQLKRYQRDLNREIETGTTRGTAKYQQLKAKIQEVNAAIEQQRGEIRGTNTMWHKMGKAVSQFGMLALGYLGITEVTNGIRNLTKRSGEYSDQLAAVQKTTGLTAQEVEYLSSQFKSLNTRTARKELLEMAKVAGKLGISELKDVEGFVRAFDKINVALGEDLGNPEEVARKLGKLVDTFKLDEIYGIEQSLLKVGSAINELGKSSTANEGYIVEFARRMAGIAPLANISIQDTLGLGATLDALGQTAEVSSTALSKLFLKMSQDSAQFAKYARSADGATLSTEQFATLIDTDFNEAFISLLRGVKDNANGMNELAATLGDLELDGGRVIGVLGTLANNTELLYKQQKISNTEFANGTSVLEEFALMNETLGAKLEKVGKKLYAIFVNSSVVRGIESIVGAIDQWLSKPLSEELSKEQMELNVLVHALMNANTNAAVRTKLIDELQAKYPGFLKNTEEESTNTNALAARLAEVNQEYRKKILLQASEEEVTAMIRQQVTLMNKMVQAEKDLQTQLAKPKRQYGGVSGLGGALNSNPEADGLKAKIERLKKEMSELDTEIVQRQSHYEELARRMGVIDLPSSKKSTTKIKSDGLDMSASSLSAVSPGAAADTMADAQAAAIKGLQNWYDSVLLEQKMYREQGLINEAEYNLREQELKLAHLEGLREIQVLFGEDTLKTDQELSDLRFAMQQKEYDEQKKQDEERMAREKEYQALLAQRIEYYVNAAFAAIDSAKTVKEAYRNILAAIRQEIKAEIVKAITKIIVQAFASPDSVATFGAAGAAKAGTIIAAMKGLLAKTKGESFYHGGETDASYYMGGETGYASTGGRDLWGSYAGMTHKGEFVEPAWIRGYPDVINAEKVMKARMAGHSLTSGALQVNSTLDASQMQAVAAEYRAALGDLTAVLAVLTEKGIPAVLSDDTLRRGNDRLLRYQANKSRGTL